jgi:polyphosphate kinase 2
VGVRIIGKLDLQAASQAAVGEIGSWLQCWRRSISNGSSNRASAVPQRGATGALMSGPSKLTDEQYEELLKPMAKELSAMARWVSETRQRMVILFEGRDTAGKGGSIDMFARLLNPRQCRVVALPSPSEREKTQWYFQRYIEHLPASGEIVLFDRSWYNRAGVEKVMGFCTPDQTQDFLNITPDFERHLIDDGMLLYKYWLCCDQEIQEERFENRLNNPMKRWKLSPIDIKAREHYDDYTEARELMLAATHTDFAPWTLVDFNDQPLGRLTLLRNLLDRVPDTELPLAEIHWPPLEREPSREHYGVLEPIPNYPVDEKELEHEHRHHHHHEHH